jgi:hypothetical protein
MKRSVLFILMLVLSVVAHADCGTSSSLQPTIGEVQARLNCLTAENQALRQQISQLQSKLPKPGDQRVFWKIYPPGKLSISQNVCEERAIEALEDRQATPVRRDEQVVSFLSGMSKVVVLCGADDDDSVYGVISLGPDPTTVRDLNMVTDDQVFSPYRVRQPQQ